MRFINQSSSPYYDSIEFNLATGQTDYDLDAQQTGFLADVAPSGSSKDYPRHIVLRTDQTISVKLNATTNDAITVAATDSPFEIDAEVRNLFLTNASGSTAAIKILALP